MLLQLGNTIFQKTFAPDTITRADETTYAEHALISQKPRLQPTASNLEEIELPLKLRAEYCNVTQTILQLKNSKDTFEVLPLLMGNGRYLGDFVITKIEETQTVAFADGAAIEAIVNISLKEFVVPNKLQQQQNAQRKQAFAVGAKIPVRTLLLQKNTAPQISAQELSSTYANAAMAQSYATQYASNTSAQPQLSIKIEAALKHANTSLQKAYDTISGLSIPANKADILLKIQQLQNAIGKFVFPVTDAAVLDGDMLNMQQKIKQLKTTASTLLNLVLTRAA